MSTAVTCRVVGLQRQLGHASVLVRRVLRLAEGTHRRPGTQPRVPALHVRILVEIALLLCRMVLLHVILAIAQLLWSRRLQHGVLDHVHRRLQLRGVQRWWPKRWQVRRRVQLLLVQRQSVRLMLVQQQPLRQHGRRQVLWQQRMIADWWCSLPIPHFQLTTDCSYVT